MVTKTEILQELLPFNNKEKIIVERQTTNDIVSGILKYHNKYINEYEKIAKYFYNKNFKLVCKNVFQFLKNNTTYKIEPANKQQLNSPSAILCLDGIDCKSYSLFINGVLDACRRLYNLDCDIAYRFSGYTTKNIEHVFSVAANDYEEIWTDPVLENFNEKKQPLYYKDKNVPMLVAVNGINQIPQFNTNSVKQIIAYGNINRVPLYTLAGKINPQSIGEIDLSSIDFENLKDSDLVKVISQLDLGGILNTLSNFFSNLFGAYVSDGEQRKAEFDQRGVKVDDIAKYYIKNRNNFSAYSDWTLNEFVELYGHKAPQQGHGWTDRTNEIRLSTGKVFNEIVKKYLPNNDWQGLLLNENKMINDLLPNGKINPNFDKNSAENPQEPTTSGTNKIVPLALGLLLLKAII